MMLIRRFEEKAAEAYALGKIGGFLHLYIGEEAVAVGATSVLRPDDYAIAAYREHGHCLAKGADPRRAMAELFGRGDGLMQGQGRLDAPVRQVASTSWAATPSSAPTCRWPPAWASPSSTGAATRSIVCYFGDGAVPEGEFHEAMNLAALWKLPVIFLCENNRYAMGTSLERALAETEIWKFGRAYNMPVRAGGRHGRAGRARGRSAGRWPGPGPTSTPTLIEARTYRFRGHSMRDPAGAVYRTKEEVEREKLRDPIVLFRERALKAGWLTEADVRDDREETSTT